MSTAAEPPVIDEHPDFILGLLQDQQSLSAVDLFSRAHDASDELGSGELGSGELGSVGLANVSVANAEPAQSKYYRDLMPATPPDADHQYAFSVDLDACSGCKACVVACHTLNGLEEEESWRRVGVVTSTPSDGLPIVRHVTTACHHCEQPGCLAGCPVRAYEKDPQTGIVRHLDDQCIGCKYCTMTCPYEVPRYSKRLGIVRKCDMCHNRLSAGEAPACVQSCPNEAIRIDIVPRRSGRPEGAAAGGVDRLVTDRLVTDRLVTDRLVTDRLVTGAPDSAISRPTTRYTGADLTDDQISMPQDHGVDHPAEDHWPLAIMLVATQISVGVLGVERVLSMFAGSDWYESVTPWTTLIAMAVAGAGLGIAPLHLGQPLKAWRVFLGLRTSWLSREAVILGKYSALLGAGLFFATMPIWRGIVPEHPMVDSALSMADRFDWVGLVALWLAVPLGLAGLYASAMIYIATRRQLWRMNRTLIRFFGSAAIGGLVGVGVVAAGTSRPGVAVGTLVLAAAGLTAKLMYENRILMRPSLLTNPSDALGRYDDRSRKLIQTALQPLARIRMVSGWVGVGVIAAAAAVATVSIPLSIVVGMLACAIVLIGEICERLLYFSSVVYDRMPGTLS